MEENIETVGAQFPSLHPRICVTLAAYHAGRTALLKTVGSEGVLSNDGEYDAFVRRLVDLNSAISDSSPNSSQELFPVVQISTVRPWINVYTGLVTCSILNVFISLTDFRLDA